MSDNEETLICPVGLESHPMGTARCETHDTKVHRRQAYYQNTIEPETHQRPPGRPAGEGGATTQHTF